MRKGIGDKQVLKGLSLAVPAHSVFGFIGKNGAGKATTLNAVLGLLKPDDIKTRSARLLATGVPLMNKKRL